jgi:hypothetical protein
MANRHAWNERFDRVHRDLLEIFGRRLQALVAYQSHFGIETGTGADAQPAASEEHAHAMVLVETLTYADLVGCGAMTGDWAKAGVGTPLILTREEFEGSLDAFPLEFSAIAAHHVLIAGADPFADLPVDPADVRRACETQAKSHLLHLRGGFLEARGDAPAVARLVAASVPPLRTLLLSLARLDGVHARSREALVKHASSLLGVPEALFEQLLATAKPADIDRSDALRIFAAYLDAMERLARFVDGWAQQ